MCKVLGSDPWEWLLPGYQLLSVSEALLTRAGELDGCLVMWHFIHLLYCLRFCLFDFETVYVAQATRTHELPVHMLNLWGNSSLELPVPPSLLSAAGITGMHPSCLVWKTIVIFKEHFKINVLLGWGPYATQCISDSRTMLWVSSLLYLHVGSGGQA